ncbi:MAG: hypothetical protein ACRCUE_08145 [Bosea sp. (in: a-proteobacteria)]
MNLIGAASCGMAGYGKARNGKGWSFQRVASRAVLPRGNTDGAVQCGTVCLGRAGRVKERPSVAWQGGASSGWERQSAAWICERRRLGGVPPFRLSFQARRAVHWRGPPGLGTAGQGMARAFGHQLEQR